MSEATSCVLESLNVARNFMSCYYKKRLGLKLNLDTKEDFTGRFKTPYMIKKKLFQYP